MATRGMWWRRSGNPDRRQEKLISVKGRDIGVFNVKGEYFALPNRCPHPGGPLCRGKHHRSRGGR